jgi:DNA-binding NarL/FixJ family response regulator
MSATPLKVLVVDDCPLVREALPRLLAQAAPDITLLEADCVGDALACMRTHHDLRLVVLDIELAAGAGLDAVRTLASATEDVPVLVFSVRDDGTTAQAALAAGARGLVSKRAPTAVLAQVIRLVLAGGTYVPPQALRELRGAASPAAEASSASTAAPTATEMLKLTARQLDVLALLLQGLPNKSICRSLNMCEGTVKTHIGAIFRTLNVRNRTEVAYAISRRGIRLPAITERAARVGTRPKPAAVPAPAFGIRAACASWLGAVAGPRALALAD